MAIIGDYSGTYNSTDNIIAVFARFKTQKYYGEIPSAEEWNTACGVQGVKIRLLNTFSGCADMVAAPKIPNDINSVGNTFNGCASLIVAPKLPSIVVEPAAYNFLRNCTALILPATIPNYQATDINTGAMYEGCTSLPVPVSIPKCCGFVSYMYSGCTELSGEFCIRPTTLYSYSSILKNTVKPITIYGDQALCEAVAATANNGNASWQPWYEPVPAVTDRGQGSYTTADDMTRMVRNGVLAVDSYAPGRMVYHQGDIVREDEWEALVEAAQTIDPTVTMSTHYTNLNKIEKAFDDAL